MSELPLLDLTAMPKSHAIEAIMDIYGYEREEAEEYFAFISGAVDSDVVSEDQ